MTRRDERLGAVYTQLETISRRAVARSRKASTPLTVVQHTLLTFIAGTPECRAIDIAAALRLNRSTVSRQVGDLAGLGLVETRASGASVAAGAAGAATAKFADASGAATAPPSRGQILVLTSRGRDLLDRSLRANHDELERRLADWSDAEVDRLAGGLERFNSVDD